MSDFEVKLTYEELRKLVQRVDDWGANLEDYERTSYSSAELALRLRNLLQTRCLDDEAFDLLMAISCAIEGRHRGFRLGHEYPREGSVFAKITQHERYTKISKMADEVDIAIAEGEKAEAAVASVMERYQLSRKEVFRRLKEARSYRALTFSACKHLNIPQNEGDDCPVGYNITEEGKLIRVAT
jgi:hypothetical protein